MLKEASLVSEEVKKLFGHAPDIHVRYRSGAIICEVQVFAPRCQNVGRGETLRAALQHLKEVNGHA